MMVISFEKFVRNAWDLMGCAYLGPLTSLMSVHIEVLEIKHELGPCTLVASSSRKW